MRRLDGGSALMIYSDVPRCYQHTLKIAMLDFDEAEGGYRFPELMERLSEHIDATPVLKWKIARVPFGLNHPYWVQDLEFDIGHHVRRIACPAPGDKRAFCALVSQLYAQSLNKSMPLWCIWVVEGLERGRVAAVAMLHHAYTDGVGASVMLRRLTSQESAPALDSAALGVDPRGEPGRLRLFAQGSVELPLMFARNLPSLLRDWRKLRSLARDYRGAGREAPPSPASSPASPLLNAPYAHGRTFFYESLDLASFKELGKSFGATINDLLLAVVASALRRWYEESGLGTGEPLVASIPVNMRSEEQRQEILGNYVTASAVSLPIHMPDPLERLLYVRESATTMKRYVEATQGVGLVRAAELLPPLFANLVNWVVRRSEGRITPFGNLAISNVPGPRQPLYFAPGVRIGDWLSIGQVMLGVSLNITAWSYVGRLNVCLMANRATIADGERFFGHFTHAYEEYAALRGGA